MAAQYSVSCGKTTTGALTTGSAKSLWLLNPVTDDGVLCEVWASCGSIVAQTDIALELYRVTSLGSPAGTTTTPKKDTPDAAASNWTALTALSAEPTTVETLRELYLPVNQGFVIVYWPLGREAKAAEGGGGARIGLRVVNDEAGTMTAVNMRSTVAWVKA